MSDVSTHPTESGWLHEDDCRLSDFIDILQHRTDLARYPHAMRVDRDVLVYDCGTLAPAVEDPAVRRIVQAELADALLNGPGIFVLQGAFPLASVVDRVSDAFRELIDRQNKSGLAAGDHFAKPGANDRIWNALEKLALLDPVGFADYYANDMIALAATAWLGPGYQVTSQVNQVNPGGAAQMAHVDYHLGFQTNDVSQQYPPHVHALSPVLTLQGAVAHVDMPVESGPTLYLPNSQKYPLGYLAWRNPDFRAYFDANHVQLALAKGDAVFFNPSLFHAAGHNRTTDVRRLANLLQVSSAFGRAMETVNRTAVVSALYPTLLSMKAAGAAESTLWNIVAASAEGYPFPSNLDRDPPLGGLAPETQAAITWRLLQGDASVKTVQAALAACDERHR
jgi:ectoine hydroxylase-related dioxygenase (phytanoyl-CoA dioxygenase family)